MMDIKEPLYCITARNRLTGEREIISNPMPRKQAEDIRLEFANKIGPRKPYTHSKVEPYVPQKDLFNNN